MEYVASEKVNVEFYMDSVHSAFESEKQGHPVYVEMPFIRIVIPGSQSTIIETKVDPTHKQRFPEQWRRFQAGQSTEGVTGWRLEQWPQVNTAQVKTMKHMNVHTVEALAGLSDTAAQSMGMGVMELRTRAKAALQAAAGNAQVEAQASANQRMEDEIASLRAQIAGMAVEASAHQEPTTKRGPGRPAKVE